MTCFVKESWSSASDSSVSAYDTWIDKLKAAQGSDWCPGKRPSGSFNASLRHKVIGELNVIESRCDPCSGFRTKDHAARIDEPIGRIDTDEDKKEIVFQSILQPSIGSLVSILRHLDVDNEIFKNKNLKFQP